MDQDTKKMVKQTITYDDGTETVINYTSLGEKVEGEAVEESQPEVAVDAPEEEAEADTEGEKLSS